jgi:hypothetical protein
MRRNTMRKSRRSIGAGAAVAAVVAIAHRNACGMDRIAGTIEGR